MLSYRTEDPPRTMIDQNGNYQPPAYQASKGDTMLAGRRASRVLDELTTMGPHGLQ